MLKKVILAVLTLCLLGISVMAENTESGEMPFGRQMQGNFDASKMPQGFDPSQMPQGFDPSKMQQGGFDPSKMPQGGFDSSKMPQGNFGGRKNESVSETQQSVTTNKETPQQSEEKPQTNKGQAQFGGGFQGGMGAFSGNMQTSQTEQEMGFLGFVKTYFTPITSVILLALAFVFVLLYKRKRY